ncbi:MAG: HEAT repeat domain-containing protein [Cytophagales bacterium]|nr:HEAT repeat domain-containing protein [Cytophagales bacterium]
MPSYKTDESFLEKISIGAIGTQKVFEHLKNQGHTPIELERGSMSYKIWKKIKIKRIRVPDILLVDCGVRIESRAKTKLEITMSHSESDPVRGWDYGMKDNDLVALVVCTKVGEEPIDWQADDIVQYISVKALRKAAKVGRIDFVKPKGAEEGFEARITWPAAVASASGTINQITDDRIQFKRSSDDRTISLSLTKKGVKMRPLVKEGESILQNQIIASVVPVYQYFDSSAVDQTYFISTLSSTDLSDRYAAAKALSHFKSDKSEKALLSRIEDANEHIYVKLEAAASLARFGNNKGYEFIETCLADDYAQNVLETIIVLAETKSTKSCALLGKVLQDENYAPEIRAGAAWALGEQNNKNSLSVLVKSFNSVEESIKVEAARALAKLTKKYTPDILKELDSASSMEKPGIAWALTIAQNLQLDDLLNQLKDLDSRQWVSYIIGKQGQEKYIKDIEELKKKDPEVYFAVTLLWKIMTSWVFELKEY